MNLLKLKLIWVVGLFLGIMPGLCFAALLSISAGRVGDVVLTSREVLATHLLEIALYQQPSKTENKIDVKLDITQPRSHEFIRETTTSLLEAAIDLEASNYKGGRGQISEATVQSQVRTAMTKLKGLKIWRDMAYEPAEIESLMRRKMRAKEYIKFKIDSSTIPISDKEVEEYFNANRLKFENLPFENFKDTIKKYLTKQQVDRRMRDWFELLNTKYQIRNYLSE